MANFKEIVTKAVIGKGKKRFQSKHTIKPNELPTNVLGCWVINHKYKANKLGDDVMISGNFDVNLWYSHSDNTETKALSKTFSYSDKLRVAYDSAESLNDNTDIIVRTLTQPTAVNCTIVDGEIVVDLEKEFGVEVVGETKIRVSVESLIDTWPEISDDDDTDSIDNIDTNYLNK